MVTAMSGGDTEGGGGGGGGRGGGWGWRWQIAKGS